jgi:hypothetical protein
MIKKAKIICRGPGKGWGMEWTMQWVEDNEIQCRMVLANIKDSKKVSCGLEGDITP